MKNELKLFEDSQIRTAWDGEKEEWYFSIVDVVGVLTESPNPNNYWKVLKKRLKDEGNQSVTTCNQLKLKSPKDGKHYLTDVADTEQLLRIIQSIPSPKAEPFKMWLAEVGNDRINEIADPEKTIQRAYDTYRKKGYSEEWINQRMKTIEMRKELTDEWQRSGVKQGKEYAILTNEISQAWSGMTTKEYKNFKGLKKENLRDNMSNLELVLNMLAEVSTTEISRGSNPQGFEESKKVARQGGNVARNAREEIEKQSGKSAITSKTAKHSDQSEEKQLLTSIAPVRRHDEPACARYPAWQARLREII